MNTTDFIKKACFIISVCLLFLKRRSVAKAKRVPEMSVRFINVTTARIVTTRKQREQQA